MSTIFSTVTQAQWPANICTSFTPDYLINVASTTSGIGLTGVISNKTFILNADLTVNNAVQFHNCLFKINTGKRIKITTNQAVIFFSSNLYNCGAIYQKWFGIELASSISPKLTISYCNIENATNGIYMNNRKNVQLDCYNNNFYNNHIGIYVLNHTEFKINYNFGNKFHGAIVNFTGSTPLLTSLPAYGIKVEKSPYFNIGNYYWDQLPITAQSEFYHLYIQGVYLDSTTCVMRGVKFYDFYKVTASPPIAYAQFEGCGIFSIDSDLSIENQVGDTYPTNSFNNLRYGIALREVPDYYYSLTYIHYTNFYSCAMTAIYGDYYAGGTLLGVYNSNFYQTQTTSNTFYNTTAPFTGIHSDAPISVDVINNNNFYLSYDANTVPTQGYQVYYNGYNGGSYPTLALGSFYQNTFANSVTNGTSILCLNFSSVFSTLIRANTFISAPAPPGTISAQWQLGVLDANGLVVKQNNFNNPLMRDGIHLQGNYNSLYCQNTINKNTYGIHATLENEIDLAKTTFGSHNYGLFLDKIGTTEPIIGPQYFKENEWPVTNVLQAYNESTIFSNVIASLLTVDPSLPNNYPTFSPTGWVNPMLNTGERNMCENQAGPEMMLSRDPEELSWESKYEWYKIISNRTPQNDFEQGLLELVSQTKIPELAALETVISINLTLKEEQLNSILSKRNAVMERRFQIEEIFKPYGMNELSESDSVKVEDLNREIAAISEELKSELQSAQHERQQNLESAYGQLVGLQDLGREEETYKAYLELVVKVNQKGKDDPENLILARALASKDDAVYGHGARKAHYFLTNEEIDNYIAYLGTFCQQEGSYELPPVNDNVRSVSEVTIEKIARNEYIINNNQDKTLKYNIWNISGGLIQTGVLLPGETTVDLRSFASGYYFINAGNGVLSKKLFIEP